MFGSISPAAKFITSKHMKMRGNNEKSMPINYKHNHYNSVPMANYVRSNQKLEYVIDCRAIITWNCSGA
jgi:hypothetical protein